MMSDHPRAGFWRRWFSALIDGIVAYLPFQIIVAILFAATSGWVQMTGGLVYSICDRAQISEQLAPPPPANSNAARECRVYFFGMETARRLTVGRVTKQGTTTTTVSQDYMLDRNGHVIAGLSIDWLALVALAIYVIAMETLTGASLGDRVTGISVVEAPSAAAAPPGAPLRKIVVRYLALLIGWIPAFAVLIYFGAAYGSDLDAKVAGGFIQWLILAAIPVVVWYTILLVQIASKSDPVYDRIAGTAVVRTTRRAA